MRPGPGPDSAREGRFILLLGALVAFGPLAVDLYLPALPAIAAGLGSGPEAVQATVTVFLAGFSLGMLGYGPISDRYGRRPVMLGGIALFVLASLGCMLATDVGGLVAARFVQALGGGAASVLARTVVRDVYASTEAIRKLSLMAMVTAIAPLLAPLVGSAALAVGGWRATFALLVGWGALCLYGVWAHLPETLAPERRGQMSIGTAFGAYGRLLLDPVAVGLVLAGGMSFAAMFAYITGGPFYFITLHGFSPTQYSLIFAANAVGIFVANYTNSRLVRRLRPPRMIGVGCALGLVAALALPLVVGRSLPAALGALFLVVSVTGLLGANCVGLLMQAYPGNAGAAAALFGASQFGFGMLASGMVGQLHDGTGRPMAGVIAVAALLSAGGFLLYRSCRAPDVPRDT